MGFYDGFAALGEKLKARAHTRILKRPKGMYFKCSCGCEFETEVQYCKRTTSELGGDRCGIQTTYWSHCPICGDECSSFGAKQ